jgi:hypothetical protein
VAQAIWDKFCAQFSVVESCVPLFAIDPDANVQCKTIGRGHHQREILMRSEEMDAMILSVTDRLNEDWHSGSHQFDGMIYMMGCKQSGNFLPLYIGKTETFGHRRRQHLGQRNEAAHRQIEVRALGRQLRLPHRRFECLCPARASRRQEEEEVPVVGQLSVRDRHAVEAPCLFLGVCMGTVRCWTVGRVRPKVVGSVGTSSNCGRRQRLTLFA